MIKALFFDIDGTLVSFQTHKVPQSTCDALRRARENGVKVFIASGRPPQLLDNISDVTPLMDGYVLATGALCMYEGKVVRKDVIPEEEVREVVRICQKENVALVVVGTQDLQIVNRNEVYDRVFRDLLKVSYNKFDVPLEDVIAQGVLQMTPFLTDDEEQRLLPPLPGCASARWHPTFCDLTSAAADKANGIRAIARHLGIGIAETMAFGDGGNDITMLQSVGTGVAMGNALDEVKQAAHYITTDVDHDGVKNALEHFGII